MQLSELLLGTDVDCGKFSNLNVCGVSYDTRRMHKNDVYISFGNIEYAIEAYKKGAALYIGETFVEGLEIPQLITSNARRTAAFAYANFYENPQKKMRIIGVTGTNGKTSTAFMLKNILSHDGYKTALCGTVKCLIGDDEYIPNVSKESQNNFQTMTTPDPDVLYMAMRDMVEKGVEILVMEVSSHALALEKLAPIEFEIGVFTNLSKEHLDFHKDMESYLAAKTKLFKQCKKGVINTDDAYSKRIIGNASCKVITYGIKEKGDYFAERIVKRGINGSEYVLHSANARFKVKTTIPGDFTLYNTLAAAVTARELNVNLMTVQNALYAQNGICGRLERVKLGFEGNTFSVFIDYAHTPFALENLLKCVNEFRDRGQRIVTLFGCGGDRDKEKRSVMGKIAVQMSDFVIITSDNSRGEEPREIINDILLGASGFDNFTVIENRKEAIEYAIENAIDGDIVLLVGKGHEQYEINKKGMFAFCESEIAKEAAKKRR